MPANKTPVRCTICVCTVVTLLLSVSSALGGPFVAPADMRLRHDLLLLDDAGLINVPVTTWPLAWDDVMKALDDIDPLELAGALHFAYLRLKSSLRAATETGDVAYRVSAGAAVEPRAIRTFEDTPRDEGQLTAGLAWAGDRFAVDFRATATANPGDGDEFRPDGSFAGVILGNWMLSAGWQGRWWGPGRDGSLILSTNARPVPALAIQRMRSTAFESPWLSWIGPWTLTAFVGRLDDVRTIDDALLLGARAAFRPVRGLEIGVSRTAQLCGDNRPCDASTFADLLVGNDNRGVNVDPAEEPGNQLGGFDFRWSLPGKLPFALYAQWIAEDSRRGGPAIGSWLRQAGIEYHGAIGALPHRMHFEIAETSCRDGGIGFSELVADCAYEHSIYRTGYRYNGRPIAHGIDGDGLSYSFGVTLVQSAGHAWSATVRHMDINRAGQASAQHTLSALPQERLDVQVSHRRDLAWGAVHAGLGYRRIDDVSSAGESDITGFLQWSTR